VDFVRPVEAIVSGAQGRVLAVLAETTAWLNLRTLAGLAGVSQAQASRLLPALVQLGVVERREVPPSALFRLVPEHIAARAILGLARSTDLVLDELGAMARSLPVRPASVIVFGSFARREARSDSDVDVVFVRPADVDEDDERWADAVERWRTGVQRLTGNPVEVLELSGDEAAARMGDGDPLWVEILRVGRVVYGLGFDDLRGLHLA
jgi:predicted nucleotidyltransferase